MAKQFLPSIGGGKIPPWNHARLWHFCHLGFKSALWIWTTLSPRSWDIRQGPFQPLLHFQLIRLTLKAHWAFLSIYTQKRLIHSGANGFKPDNVPLSLRDTGYCHSDHKVSAPVAQSDSHKRHRFKCRLTWQGPLHVPKIWTELSEVTEIAQVQLYCGVSGCPFPLSPNHCHLTHAHYEIYTCSCNIYVYRWIYTCNFPLIRTEQR